MDSFLALLKTNEIVVYSVYGQVFFSLGIVVALHSRRHSRLELAQQLAWLAAFGLTHGLYEWAHVFIPIQAAYLPEHLTALLSATRPMLLGVSFLLLAQFGCLLAFPAGRSRRFAQATFAFLALAWVVWSVTATDLLDGRGFLTSIWARRLLGLPAAAVAALGMFRQSRAVAADGFSSIARDFRIAAVSFAAYAGLAGFVVSPAPDAFAPDFLVSGFSLSIFGLPAPLLRSLAGLGIVFGIVRGLRIFEMDAERTLQAAERSRLKAAEQAREAMESMAQIVSQNRGLDGLLPAALIKVAGVAGARKAWLTVALPGKTSSKLGASLGLEVRTDSLNLCQPSNGCPCLSATPGGATVLPVSHRCSLLATLPAEEEWTAIPVSAQGRVLGMIHLAGSHPDELLGLLTSMGRQLGLAVENAQLASEVARKELARAQLLRKAISAQEEERRRVARELHDQTGQSLIGVIMTLGAAGERLENGPPMVSNMVEDARQVAVQALESTREMIMGLRPAALDDLGLVPALRRFAEDLGRKHRLSLTIESSELPRRLPPEVELAVFRILQESLNNVVRHSGARRATVRFTFADSVVVAEVCDDGCGFDLADATADPRSGRGLGLLGMTERAGLLGGTVTVDTLPGRGSRVLVTIPVGLQVRGLAS